MKLFTYDKIYFHQWLQWAISPFTTIFSTQSDNCIPIGSYFWHHIFICCWIWRAWNWHMRLKVHGKQRQIVYHEYVKKSKRWTRWCGICQGSQWKKWVLWKNKQTVIYDELAGRTRQRTNDLRDELIWGRTLSYNKGLCIIAPIERYSSYRCFP